MQNKIRVNLNQEMCDYSGRFFRLNCEQNDKGRVQDLLSEEGFAWQELSEACPVMAAVREPFSLGSSLAHYFGFIYIQDIASSLPALLLGPSKNSTVLDMCASPGSKTGQISEAVGPGGLVVANEPNPSRLATLRANLKRLNLVNVITSGYSGQNFPSGRTAFDYILLDVPCSGWGTVNRNPAAARIWTGDRLASLISLQKMLLQAASDLLTPGGRLVYSTCTTNEKENEDQITWACSELLLKSLEPTWFEPEAEGFPEIEVTGPGMMRVKGANMGGQDFFMACLGSRGSGTGMKGARSSRSRQAEQVAIGMDIRQPAQGSLYNFSGNVFFVPDKAWEIIDNGLAVQGTHVGRVKGQKFILSPRMRVFLPKCGAESGFCTSDAELIRNLVNGQSLVYSSPGGLAGFYWKSLGLGWLKNRNNRLFWSDR